MNSAQTKIALKWANSWLGSIFCSPQKNRGPDIWGSKHGLRLQDFSEKVSMQVSGWENFTNTRCNLSLLGLSKQSKQCLCEYNFAPVCIKIVTSVHCYFQTVPHSNMYSDTNLCCCIHDTSCICKVLDWLQLIYTMSNWTARCPFGLPGERYAPSNEWHLQEFYPMCTLIWTLRCSDTVNALSHSKHLYSLSPMWIFTCLFRCPDSPNALSHTRHLYSFSPLWTVPCLTRWVDWVNRLLQTVHSNGFCPKWHRLCTVNCLLFRKHFPHSRHLYLLPWTFMCVLR